MNEIYNKLKEICYNSYSKEKSQDKYKYYFPELQYHKDYWTMIQERKQKELEEKKRKREIERFERENNIIRTYKHPLPRIQSITQRDERFKIPWS